ncbi:MAG: class I SAM-dependent methyltransferase [Nitrospira sp.]|nr:class I SAM-dependent methyltransferase [Nitrospira sp.]
MNDEATDPAGYRYSSGELNVSHRYLLPAVVDILNKVAGQGDRRIFELGCGNGSVANTLADLGFDITGVDPSSQAVHYATSCYPSLKIFQDSAYQDLTARYGKYSTVLSLEVIEHVYFPRKFASVVYDLLVPGGTAIISTPYHGYLKNVFLSVSGKMDAHFTALWDHGHIKFWSMRTLQSLLNEAGFDDVSFIRVGRIPLLAKSMIAIAKKPSADCVERISP